jgi:hypothetical protein
MKQDKDIPILIADFGRSGQGWLSYMLCYILNARYVEPYCLLRGIVYSGHQDIITVTQGALPGRESTPYSMVIKTHGLPDPFFSLTEKVILLARDPRDVAVSGLARYRVRYHTGSDVEMGARDIAFGRRSLEEARKEGKAPPPSLNQEGRLRRFINWVWTIKPVCFFVLARRWGRFYDAWDDVYIAHRVTYEELSRDPAAALKGILAYLEVTADETLIDEAVQRFAFANLAGRKKGVERQDDVAFRKGVVGDFKNHFNPFYSALFRWLCGESAEKWGYRL